MGVIMRDNYARIVRDNLNRLYDNIPEDLAQCLPAKQIGEGFLFDTFGKRCEIRPDRIFLGDAQPSGPLGIILTLYALYARPEPCILEPFKAFKDLPDSTPYVGAFTTHTEHILVPHVERIERSSKPIIDHLGSRETIPMTTGDFSLLLTPLPKITLYYIFYRSDEDFPASVTCLLSNNAPSFLPVDALADVGEYTSKTIIQLIE